MFGYVFFHHITFITDVTSYFYGSSSVICWHIFNILNQKRLLLIFYQFYKKTWIFFCQFLIQNVLLIVGAAWFVQIRHTNMNMISRFTISGWNIDNFFLHNFDTHFYVLTSNGGHYGWEVVSLGGMILSQYL